MFPPVYHRFSKCPSLHLAYCSFEGNPSSKLHFIDLVAMDTKPERYAKQNKNIIFTIPILDRA